MIVLTMLSWTNGQYEAKCRKVGKVLVARGNHKKSQKSEKMEGREQGREGKGRMQLGSRGCAKGMIVGRFMYRMMGNRGRTVWEQDGE